MLFVCDVQGNGVLRWCQGEVLEVEEEKSKPTVKVSWDAMSDVTGCEEKTESCVELMPSKWNPKIDCSGAWRLDVDIEYSTEKDNGGDVESLENESEESSLDYGSDSDDSWDSSVNDKYYGSNSEK